MNVSFDNKELVKLYVEGKSKKYQLQANVLKKFFMAIEILEAAVHVQDLWAVKSFGFEKLQGYDNRFSMRLNIQYRLELRIEFTDDLLTTGDIYIEEISNHYA